MNRSSEVDCIPTQAVKVCWTHGIFHKAEKHLLAWQAAKGSEESCSYNT